MRFSFWLRNWKRSAPAAGGRTQTSVRHRTRFRPRLEALEDRLTPSSGYVQTNLTGYEPGSARFIDPNLNGWGMTSLPNGSFCVANAFSNGTATFYDHSGNALPRTIKVPVEATESAVLSSVTGQPISTQYGHPTGVVYNPTNDFVITNPETHVSAPATLIFDTLDGIICGWNPVVDPTHAIVIRDALADTGAPAVYTSLEIGQDSSGQNVLYATDFYNNQLEVIGSDFKDINTISCAGLGVSSNLNSSVTTDPNSSVWSVSAVNDKLIVTFADLLGPVKGGGAVDVFNTDGVFQYQIDANDPDSNAAGRLQNPWGVTLAPANFGMYSNDLLVGNVWGHGNINAYKPDSNGNYTIYAGQLSQPNGTPIAIKGLWDMEFDDGPHLFFDAGPNHPGDGTGGLFGVIRAAGDLGNQLVPQEHASIASTSIVSSPTMPSLIKPSSTKPTSTMPTWIMPTSTVSSSNGVLEQQIDAIFQEVDAVLFSLDANHTAMHLQRSGFFARLPSNLNGLEATILDRLEK
ncbi:MAG TPA: TIGR03118 family protein [Gemmataceae bacterium]|nr:TIGR03118 family protein [Gemmataceae bacterium]